MEQLSQYSIALLWPPLITLVIAIVAAAYLVLIGPKSGKRFGGAATWGEASMFLVSMFIYWIAWGTPIHLIGEVYLMMAHMLTMLLVTIVAPPFMIMGLPQSVLDRALQNKVVKAVVGILVNPIVAVMFLCLSFFMWHVPSVYDAAVRSLTLHLIQYAMLLLAGWMYWWPLLTKSTVLPRLRPFPQLGYTFLAVLMQTVLFGPIMILDEPIYQTYVHAPRLIAATALEDQQGAHMLMGVLSPAVLLVFFFMAFAKIAKDSGAPTTAPAPNSASK